jgi:hypothetical protein
MGAAEGTAFAAARRQNNDEYTPQSLSFQQLVSCDNTNGGCDGGNIVFAAYYAANETRKGLATLDEYPYTDAAGDASEKCLMPEKEAAINLNRATLVMTYDDGHNYEQRTQLVKEALAGQPMAISLKSTCDVFQSYGGGVLTSDEISESDDGTTASNSCHCQEVDCIDHSVLLVGYSDTHDPPYWIIKNR